MKKILCLVCGAALMVSVGYAQTDTSSSTSSTTSTSDSSKRAIDRDSANTTTRSITDNAGKVIDYTPTSITIDDGNSAAPVRFQVSDNVRIMGPADETMSMASVKKGSNVKLHFSQQNGTQMVDQIMVQKK